MFAPRYALILLSLALMPTMIDSSEARTVAWRNGQWWTGAEYEKKTMYSIDGVLRAKRPAHIDATVDLHRRYVLPPLAEGHNHWLEPARAREYSECYLADGVFYVRDMANASYIANQIRPQLNKPDTVDWVSAMEGFTGPHAHPTEVFAQLAMAGLLPKSWKPDFDKQAEFVVTTPSDIDERFPLLLEHHPALVKAFLAHSENYAENLSLNEARAQMRGMDPKLLPYLVVLAHHAGLKVAVHAYTAADFRAVVSAGADEAAHLPGTGYRPLEDVTQYLITRDDARAAARAGLAIDTTVSWLRDLKEENEAAYEIARDKIVIPNLILLKGTGAKFVIGSDTFRQTVLPELLTLQALGVFSGTELIQMATDTTPKEIFPKRKIGALNDGYEANFIVLAQDPSVDIGRFKSISLWVKRGKSLSIADWALHRKSDDCVEGPI
jgi:amidohydrolase family protein